MQTTIIIVLERITDRSLPVFMAMASHRAAFVNGMLARLAGNILILKRFGVFGWAPQCSRAGELVIFLVPIKSLPTFLTADMAFQGIKATPRSGTRFIDRQSNNASTATD
jgi:hypothetical protein